MRREVSAQISLTASGGAELSFAISTHSAPVTESLEVRQRNAVLDTIELVDGAGTRFQQVRVEEGTVEVSYSATVDGRVEPPRVEPIEELIYLRPSRYCESDTLAPLARSQFAGLEGADLLAAVSSWVGVNLSYVSGSSLPTDGALDTLLARRGVCRDYAHLVVAFLRALQVPARVAAVFAPGLDPMDFHAVAEAAVDGVWRVVDATTLAPRQTLLRIATGRDASDIAFLNVRGAAVTVDYVSVMATADELPLDDVRDLVSIG